MARRMLIDTTHPEETRVAVVNGNRLEEFDYETAAKKQLKGNIYLAKVTRVEPSLQAAFVDYGGNRHGFLAFSEIHPDYYQIPVGDRENLLEDDSADEDENGGEDLEDVGGEDAVDEAVEEAAIRRPRLRRQYKIQEVIKRRQVLLVQVVKEERGNKGAALTTYLSLAGRYCVLMPNTARGGGVSRKITNANDRKRLKSILSELEIPDGMAVILRTAGAERSKVEIRRDFDFIFKLWDDIRNKTLESTAPALIHEEGNLVTRSIRDLYDKDMEEILVAGDEGYRTAKDFMKDLIPSHAKKVKKYKDDGGIPLFQRYQVEGQLAAIHDPTVQLRSGGSIVIHQTEALVAIDVNSGKATRERHIEETALKTNLEAADEISRQLRLRDLAGLIVIDFIDMEEPKNAHAVERRLKEALRRDRARIQIGRISPFGLLEMSRQRLRPSLLEAITQQCPTCGGIGYIHSTESSALTVLRAIEEEGLRKRSSEVRVRVPTDVAIYILNHKRAMLSEIETNSDMHVVLEVDASLIPPKFEMTRTSRSGEQSAVQTTQSQPQQAEPRQRRDQGREQARDQSRDQSRDQGRDRVEETSDRDQAGDEEGNEGRSSRRRRRRGGRRRRRDEDTGVESQEIANDLSDEESEEAEGEEADDNREAAPELDEDGRPKKRRKRGRRGGRRRRKNRPEDGAVEGASGDLAMPEAGNEPVAAAEAGEAPTESHAETGGEASAPADEEAPARKPRAKKARARKPASRTADTVSEAPSPEAESAPAETVSAETTSGETTAAEAEAEKKPAKKASARKSTAKKAGAKKSTARKTAAKKSSARKPKPSEAEGSEASATPSAKPVQKESPAAAETSGVTVITESTSEAQSGEPDENKPRKRGWWNRVLG